MINALIDAAVSRARAGMLILLLLLIAGTYAYSTIPLEDTPDVQIPFIYVTMNYEGISPEDAERLLIRPMEKELRNIEGVKEMTSNGAQGFASVMLEFVAGFNKDKALQDVREKVDQARPELPEGTEEPVVNEVNLSLFPVLNVILRSAIPEREFLRLARNLRDKLEEIPSVLKVEIAGEREETIDIIVDPMVIESYRLSSEIINIVSQNNRLVAAGDIDTGEGNFQVKVPGLLEDISHIVDLPIKAYQNAVVKLKDIATVRKGFKDPEGFARVNGEPALVLEVSKRTGENIIETIARVQEVVEKERQLWPEGSIDIIYAQDKSQDIIQMVSDLENNVVFAILLVTIVLIAIIGVRSASYVALSIPGSLLIGIIVIYALGLTLNIVVLFSLILSIGMLVDSAIVIVEYANRKTIEGYAIGASFSMAAKRMAWPLITSTLTTLMVFAPLLFWPGIIGQFMLYLPLTLIATLTGSLLMALVFIPIMGSSPAIGASVYALIVSALLAIVFHKILGILPLSVLFFMVNAVLLNRWLMPQLGRMDSYDKNTEETILKIERGDLNQVKGFTGRYLSLLRLAVAYPWRCFGAIFLFLVTIFTAYGFFGKGVEFFPSIEPQNAQIIVRARGNLSVYEKDDLLREVEKRVLPQLGEIKVFYARSGRLSGGENTLPQDTIGVIQMEFSDWRTRRKASEILEEIRELTHDIPGIVVETRKQEDGPGQERDIQIQLSSRFPELLDGATDYIVQGMRDIGDLNDINDTRPIPAIEWQLDVDRTQAATFGVDFGILGNYVKLVSNGLVITTYRPDDNDEEVDVVLRFPPENRDLQELSRLRVVTENGAIPISNFVHRTAKPKLEQVERIDGTRYFKIEADVTEADSSDEPVLPAAKIERLIDYVKRGYASGALDARVHIHFKGESEDQQETQDFLAKAFLLALFGMTLIMVMQFNSIFQSMIIMSAVFLSSAGVLLGLLIAGQPYGIVMCGVGIIALAGIVVNNNIIFIDTYNQLKAEGIATVDAILRTGALRLRPILLTAGTTVLGLLPMVTQINIDFITREVTYGAPSTQWWVQLSTAIAGGLTFATLLTLFFTPALLMIGDKFFHKRIRARTIKEAS